MPDPYSNDGEFVTVSDAARRLGISDRTAQRYAVKLSDSDRQVTDIGPRLVRLKAMQEKAKKAAHAQNRGFTIVGQVSDHDGQVTDTKREFDGQVSDTDKTPKNDQSALVAQLQAENARLWDALAREQENTKAEQENVRAAMSELQRANERAAVLIAAVGTGRLQLPSVDAGTDGGQEKAQNTPQGFTGGDSGADSGAEVETPGEKPQGAAWWQFWKATGKR